MIKLTFLKEIDVNKTSQSKELNVFQYWISLNGLTFNYMYAIDAMIY